MTRLTVAFASIVPFLLIGAPAIAQSKGCSAFITTSETEHGSTALIKARNVSHLPIVAYVITNTPSTNGDTKSYSLHGVFTGGDSLHRGQVMQLGSVPRRQVKGLLQVDYVRLADGTACGAAATQDAKQIAARFD